jgi:glycosyltransferase involved in cell wall biosynthesis
MYGTALLPREGGSAMRVLAIYRHYWPDATPYARILHTLLAHFASGGHEAVAYAAQPSYNDIRQPRQPRRQKLSGVDVRRVALLPERKRWPVVRAANFGWFLLRAVLHAVGSFLRGKRYDLVIANSHPPVLMGCALRLIRALTGTPYIYHCQDVHPESAALVGKFSRGLLYRWMLHLDKAACLGALRVVVLSQDMAHSIAARGIDSGTIEIINNPPLAIDTSVRPQLPPLLNGAEPCARLLFAGNLGQFQGLERLIAAAHLAARSLPFQLVFMGDGSLKRELIQLAGQLLDRNVFFLPHAPIETALAAMRACNYGIVSLASDVYRFAYPSKSMMYLSAGCPIIALVEPASELAGTIRRYDLGFVAASRSVHDIAAAIATAVRERDGWTPERRRQLELTCQSLFGEQRMLAAWDCLLQGDEFAPTTRIDTERLVKSAATTPAA